jgi:hypothetical protein
MGGKVISCPLVCFVWIITNELYMGGGGGMKVTLPPVAKVAAGRAILFDTGADSGGPSGPLGLTMP